MKKSEIASELLVVLENGCTTRICSCPAFISEKTLPSIKLLHLYRGNFCHSIFPELKNKPLATSDSFCGLCPCDSKIGIDEIRKRLLSVSEGDK